MITVVTFDGTVDEASWTKVGFPGAAHTGLQTVDAASETTYMQAAGPAAGILKLSIPAGPPEIQRVNYYRLNPFLISGAAGTNVPALRIWLVVNGMIIQMRSFIVDTLDEFELKQVEFGPLNLNGDVWRATTREIWFEGVAASSGHIGDDPIPDGS